MHDVRATPRTALWPVPLAAGAIGAALTHLPIREPRLPAPGRAAAA